MDEQCIARAAGERIQCSWQAAGLLHHPDGILIGSAIFFTAHWVWKQD